jgi:hypothetical protein
LTVAMVLGAEVLFTLMATGQHFAWPRLILGVFGAVFILFLGQRLYAGDRGIERIALGWAGFQIVLMLASLAVGPHAQGGIAGIVQDVGLPVRYMALLKGIAYGSFAAALAAPCAAHAFVAAKRGDDVEKFLPAAVADTTHPLTWTADQLKLLGSLTTLMQIAAGVLALVGVYVILNAIPPSLNMSLGRTLLLLEGVLTLGLGALLIVPAQALADAGGAPHSTLGRLQSALLRLTWWHFTAGGIGLLLLVSVVLRFFIAWTTD